MAGCATAPQDPSGGTTSAAAAWPAIHVERAQRALSAHGLWLRPRTTGLVIHDDVDVFRAATGQDEPSLRAWTTWRAIHLLNPRHWGDDSEETRTQRITHELCHAALLHHFADEAAARAARVPRFFTEGACSVVAGQQRLPLAAVMERAGDRLPLTLDTFARDPDLAYGASHALAAQLVSAHGPLVFAQVLRAAALDGSAGCVERALLGLTDAASVPALWRRAVDTLASPT